MAKRALSLMVCCALACGCAEGDSDFAQSSSDAARAEVALDADEAIDSVVIEMDSDSMDSGDAADDTFVLDSAVSDTMLVDTLVVDTTSADTALADATVTDTAVTDTGVPDTGVADTGVADTGVADTGAPDTGAPPMDAAPTTCGATAKLLINEVLLQDPTSSTFRSAEFVELYNPNDCVVALSAIKLQYKRLASDPSPVLRWDGATASGTLKPRSFYLVASSTYSGARDETFASPYNMDENVGGLALLRGAAIVDAVGWGSPSYVEGSPALAPPMGASLARQRSMGAPRDTNNNSTDFVPTLTITPGAANP